MTATEDTTDYEALAERVSRGDLKTVRRIFEGDDRRVDLADLFMTMERHHMEETTT